MLKNIQQITTLFPEYEIWIYCGNDVPESYINQYTSYPNVKLIHCPFTGGRLMVYRFFCIDDPDVEVMITRDADSRFEKRDSWCISNFINGTHTLFTIRDHPWHGHAMMGGLSGFKKIDGMTMQAWYAEYIQTLTETQKDAYYCDQLFLEKYVYFRYKNEPGVFVAHTIRRFYDEVVQPIGQPRETPHDFCGNVVLFDDDGREYYEFSV